jgi:transcriptional regulator with XRE-family HTH domain
MEKLQIGDMIRVLRRNKEITQEQLAEILDVSTPAICKWESGQTNPDINMLPVIARYFQVSIDFLLGFSTELKPEKIKNIT